MSIFFNWHDFLDILVLSGLFYALYRTLRSSGTWQIALGITLSALGFGLASLLQLRGVGWIFSNLSQVALLGMIIIFQPEIRRVLERTTALSRGLNRTRALPLADVLAESLFALAALRRGALVVIPGQLPVRQWITEGIAVDGKVSVPLLLSIFDPNSPGHDGAVVLEGARIARLGVRLPLSHSERLPPELGTRHHAAMGLAEATDALVIAVSEERGTVSLFSKGIMTRMADRRALEEAVAEHANERPVLDRPVELKRPPWRKTAEVVGSLAAALFFWNTIILSQTELREISYTVPVEFTKPAANLVLAEAAGGQEARVSLEGPAATVNGLDPRQLRLLVDLATMGQGRQTIALSEQNIDLPKRVRVTEITPGAIEFELLEARPHTMKIKPQLLGAPPEGFRVSEIKVTPEEVAVLIPDKDYKQAHGQLLTTPIFLGNLRDKTLVYSKLIAPPGLQAADKRLPDVAVEITLTEAGNGKKKGNGKGE